MSGDPSVPPYLSPGRIAKASGVSRKTVVTDLRDAGLLQRLGPRRYRVDTTMLRERLSAYYERVFAYYAFGPGTLLKSNEN